MTKKMWYIFITIAEIGIVVFWIAGFKGNLTVASYSFATAGVAASVALASLAAHALHKRRYGF